MKNDKTITDSIQYVGVFDGTLDLFESQYPVPNGVTYNSYVILDEKVAVLDTVDARATEAWYENLEQALGGRTVDYLIVSHMEPDHAANIGNFVLRYPEAKVVGNAKTFSMIAQFFDLDLSDRMVVVKEGSTLELGAHTLQFVLAPMVHWPEVMVTYEKTEKILFSADAFGTFGAMDADGPWDEEAARYYLNIVGKYGVQVQALLKKAAALDIQMICPLHGPVLRENLGYYLGLYQTWSTYQPESHGVLIAYASIYGNTARAAEALAGKLREQGETDVELLDLTRMEVSYALRKAFYYERMIVASSTYDGGIFPPMEKFLLRLRAKGYQKRRVGLMENGTWAPMAAKGMRAILETMKAIEIAEPVVTIRSALHADGEKALSALADEIMK